MAQRQRARPRQDRAVQTRRLLLDTAVRILDRDGIERLSTTAVIRDAHVSSGTFYRYFNDRGELLGVLREEAVRAISDDLMVSVVDALELDLDDALRLVVRTLVAGFEQHRGVIAAMVNQLPAGNNANVLPEIEGDLHRLASLLPRRHRPDLAPEQLEGVVFMLMGVLVSTCLRIALGRPEDVDREQLVDLTVAMIGAGLR
ncbi:MULTISPECIES: TetR/AcrR family transcriptional regulator [Pimelobacter]|uniref:TetR/AcrR family transcriptional regulator n=1 Tax=Pimelobacter TaxID=2044 RepID=UPI001C04872C|nr:MULTISPECIES: TetR/AcrR family transcriptional regulator [Pimelobacter]UUW87569.1 TetR/AcrR family transcriptional regulator [Pimelobacter simplex]UUW97075.1 TetR/AcrR family transcriptional regulator [Pimelobacter simplex]